MRSAAPAAKKAAKKSKPKTHSVIVVRGVFGHLSLYLDDYRIGGDKPWGGGKEILSFRVSTSNLRQAIKKRVP